MAQAHFVKKARKTIYENGKYVKRKNQKGEMVEVLDRTIPENKKDKPLIKAGESYWWWAFRFGGKNIQKTQPRRSQLTQSGFLSSLYDLEDRMGDLKVEDYIDDPSSLSGEVDEIKSELESLRDECQERYDNMPESLQENSDSGQLLQERVDNLDEMINELDGLDLSYDEADEDDDEETAKEKATEWLENAISDIQGITYNGS